MNTKAAFNILSGTQVIHTRYGLCRVNGIIPDFGPIIQPITYKGRILLQYDSGCPDCPVTELWRTPFPYLATDYKRNLKMKGSDK